jgi:hypothetical protein
MDPEGRGAGARAIWRGLCVTFAGYVCATVGEAAHVTATGPCAGGSRCSLQGCLPGSTYWQPPSDTAQSRAVQACCQGAA